MAKETFYNLPEDKKRRIFDAAVHEFAERRFGEASVNQIVKEAKIPWGSFYQYFEDKADLFAYMMEEITAELAETERKGRQIQDGGDALSQFSNRLAATVGLNALNPDYARITITQSKETDPFIKQYFELREDHRKAVLGMFEKDKQDGLVREDVDASVVIDMILVLSRELYYTTGTDGEAYVKQMEAFLEIIRNGIKKV